MIPTITPEDVDYLLRYKYLFNTIIFEAAIDLEFESHWVATHYAKTWIDNGVEWHCHGLGKSVKEALLDMDRQIQEEALNRNQNYKGEK